MVQTLCLSTLDPEAAADAAQEAFLQLYLQWDRVSEYDNPLGWVYQVALNRSVDHRRRASRWLRLWERQAMDTAQSMDAAQMGVGAWESQGDFLQAMKSLPKRQRQAVALHYVAGFSQQEAAEAMDISEGALKSHLFRARETLRKKLEVGS